MVKAAQDSRPPGRFAFPHATGGAPVFFVGFFESVLRYDSKPAYQRAHASALKLMLRRNVEQNQWSTYHEDVGVKPESYLSAEPMCFTADYLFRHGRAHPGYVDMGRQVIRRLEERLVYTTGHPAAPAPAVSEQAGFDHIMPGHTARYCLALADLYALTRDEQVRRRAIAGINALTYMQSPAGLFRTFFYSVKPNTAKASRPDWYSHHLYTVCHLLEIMPSLPEIAPDEQSHLLGSGVFARQVLYAPGQVTFATIAPSRAVLKLDFRPRMVLAGGRELGQVNELPSGHDGWSFDPQSRLLTILHPGGQVEVRSARQ